MNDQERREVEQMLRAALGTGGWQSHENRRYDATAAIVRGIESGAVREWERREPIVKKRDFTDGVGVDLARAAVTGVFVGCGTAFALGALPYWVPGFLVGAGVRWLVSEVDARRQLWRVERVTGRDLDGDGLVGDPDSQAPTQRPGVEVTVIEKPKRNHARLRYAHLSVDDSKLKGVARAVLDNGVNFSRPGLCDQAGVLTQSEYNRLAQELEAGGLLVSLPGNRRELTAAGRSLLRRALDL